MAAWKEFEKLVAKIQAEITPDAEVRHNYKIIGKRTGRKRQIDVGISKKVGLYPILIIIECKHHDNKRPVEMEKVEAFVTKLQDVGTPFGVMISNSGFDEGAKAVAKQYNVALQSYKEAQEVDWREILGPESWIRLITIQTDEPSITVTSEHGSRSTISLETPFHDENKNHLMFAYELYVQGREQAITDGRIGEFEIDASFNPPVFAKIEGKIRRVQQIVFRAVNHAYIYTINLKLATGHLLENSVTGEMDYAQLFSEGFDWRETIKTMEGKSISREEYAEIQKAGGHIGLFPQDAKYLRIVATRIPPTT